MLKLDLSILDTCAKEDVVHLCAQISLVYLVARSVLEHLCLGSSPLDSGSSRRLGLLLVDKKCSATWHLLQVLMLKQN